MQLSFDLAQRGAALAAGHADRVYAEWTDKALAALREFAETHAEFTNEDLILAATSVPAPPEKRAWGHIVLLAKKQGLIIKAGYATAKSVHSHCRPVSLWRSLTYKAGAA